MALASLRQPQYTLAHLVPLGTPAALMGFMVIIELISRVIRPLTLSVRLMANLTAGHLLLALLSSLLPNATLIVFLGTNVALVLLIVLEVAVACIQAYVFALLRSLYLEETQTAAIIR